MSNETTETSQKEHKASNGILTAISRGLALFLGAFSLLNILGELRYPGFDANHWWIDLGFVSGWARTVILYVVSIMLVWYGFKPVLSRFRRILTALLVGALAGVCIGNAAIFYWLVWKGTIESGFLLSFSLIVFSALTFVLLTMIFCKASESRRKILSGLVIILTLIVCAIGFAIGQMFCFGRTDYRRQADAIVVFGARVYADGRCSDALSDRVATAGRLQRKGLADRLILSGGPGDGDIHETEAMKKMAMQIGVSEQAILTDPNGVNTQATVENTCAMFKEHGTHRVLAVSHFYHLPRIKMSYQRQQWEVYTVPAEESYTLTEMPKYIGREVLALWLYYLRPLVP